MQLSCGIETKYWYVLKKKKKKHEQKNDVEWQEKCMLNAQKPVWQCLLYEASHLPQCSEPYSTQSTNLEDSAYS